jgi:hypothetical protein
LGNLRIERQKQVQGGSQPSQLRQENLHSLFIPSISRFVRKGYPKQSIDYLTFSELRDFISHSVKDNIASL